MDLEYGNHTIRYATTEPVLLSVGGAPAAYLTRGTGKVTIRHCGGKLETDPKKAKVHLDVVSRQTLAEIVDDLPPPAPAAPSNYLASLREKVRQSMGITREAFADFKSVYEVVDDLDTFEEDRELRQPAASEPAEETATNETVTSDTVTPEEASD